MAGAVLALLAGCGSEVGVQPVSESPWGMAVTTERETVLVGTQLWCSASGSAVTIDDVRWQRSKGVQVQDFAVVNQAPGLPRIGRSAKTIAEVAPEAVGSRELRADCQEFGEETEQPREISYLLIELALTDTTEPGEVAELVVSASGQEWVEPVQLTVCARQRNCP